MTKPSLSISEQFELLQNRGLLDSGGQLPRAIMSHGYFRLSGYWRYYQLEPSNGRNAFVHGTEFGDIFALYQIDADLRNLLLEGMSEVEVALRASLVAHLCASGGDGAEYLQTETYVERWSSDGDDLRQRLLSDVLADIARSKERHVIHHRQGGASSVPLWVATEAMSFGTLSRMYGLLADESKKTAIAKRFGYDAGLFTAMGTNLRAVAVFRNVCAHHSRVWNRSIHQDVPKMFAGAFSGGSSFRKYSNVPWGIISVLGHMVANVRNNASFMSSVSSLAHSDPAYWKGLTDPSSV